MSNGEIVLIPLEQRILDLIEEIPQWSMKHVIQLFPNEHEKALYRAVNNLVEDGRVRYLGWQGRNKQYTCSGVSSLPSLILSDGSRVTIRQLFPHIPDQYVNGRWVKLEEVDELLITFGQLFIIAQLDNKADMTENYKAILRRLTEIRASLKTILGYVETVLSHAIMSGDLSYFKATLDGDSPTAEELNEFKVWLSKYYREKRAND